MIELSVDGNDYTCHGDGATVEAARIADILDDILPAGPPGFCWDDIAAAWPNDKKPTKAKILDALKDGVKTSRYQRTGGGVKNEPHCYHKTIRTPFDKH